MAWREELSVGNLTVGGYLTGGNVGYKGSGSEFFLDPASGDDGNNGKSPKYAKKTLSAAYALMTAGKNDVLYLLGGATALTMTSAMAWNKAYTHLVGVCSEQMLSKRSRIQASGIDDAAMFTVSVRGCSFRNVQFQYGVAEAAALACVKLTSGAAYTYFENCHIMGIVNATQDAAGACSLFVDGAAECTYRNCAIGCDTQKTRSANSSEILFDGAASKQFFDDCLIYACISNAGHHLVRLADNAGLQDLGAWFKNCTFMAVSTNKATTLTEVFDVPTGGVQYIFCQNCATTQNLDAASTGSVYNDQPTANTDGDGALFEAVN